MKRIIWLNLIVNIIFLSFTISPIKINFKIFRLIFSQQLYLINSDVGSFFYIAQNKNINSLEEPVSDPLLPSSEGKRNLSALEIRRIKQEIIKLDRQATLELEQGNQEIAFQLWFRELRLQRALDREAEIKDLGRIGNIAWQNNRGVELREIAKRLGAIEETIYLDRELDYNLLSAIASAYENIKYLDRVIDIYKLLLQEAREENDFLAEQNNLEKIGNIYLARFDYRQAAVTYEALLNLVEDNLENRQETTNYLLELVNIYDNLAQPAVAVEKKTALIDKYLEAGAITEVANLKIAIANDYQSLQELQLASEYYLEAYEMAKSSNQIALQADALNQLAKLYQNNQQLEDAIATYQELIETEKRANNIYSLIDVYQNLGEIYLETKDYSQALIAFETGLEIAKSFNYSLEYFEMKIQETKQKQLN